MTDVRIACECGKLQGLVRDVSPRAGNRLVCYCDDCQAYAEYLGSADRVLDAHGGTEIFQISPAAVGFTTGTEHLACLRLTPNGVLRWYASCCNTPIGNTLPTRQIPYIGVVRVSLDPAGRSLDDLLGPVRAGVNGRFARGDRSQIDAHDRAPLGMLVRVVSKLLMWRLRGDHERSPLFDRSGRPVVEPIIVRER
ncbi:MAG TPA: DUF6151 family protein [Gammaproteobacteria bacterium]|nr:DUF6151 family protein [Gammaproteobacteria bacterium]